MPTGTLTKFDGNRGFGFLQADDAFRSRGDVFVHISDLHRAGANNPAIGNAFEYRIDKDPRTGKPRAFDVVRVW